MARTKLTARRANRFELYEKSVQCPEADVAFMDRVFRKIRGRAAVSLREDFCGSAWLCSEWVKSGPGRTAEGVDLDSEVLDYGDRRHREPLGEAGSRMRLRCEDVLLKKTPRVDVQVAFNFSYCIFRERPVLKSYFESVRKSLSKEGVFFLDLHGGAEANSALTERKRKGGFTYVWEQGPFEPVHARRMSHIHFHFPDGTRLRRAFSYDWRIWTLPEVRDLLAEAGFSGVEVYWEGTDRSTGEGNGVYRKVVRGDNDPSYICYVLGIA